MVSFIDNVTVIFPAEVFLDMSAIGIVTEWLQERLGVEGISLNREKSQALLANGVLPNDLTEKQCLAVDSIGPTVVGQEMRVAEVPVGTEQFKRDFVKEAVNGEPAEQVRALVLMDNTQASFQILRPSAVSRLSHLLRKVPPSITQEVSRSFGTLIEWVLASLPVTERPRQFCLPRRKSPKILVSAGTSTTWDMKPAVRLSAYPRGWTRAHQQ